jgi:hypothetical protein
LLQRLLQTAAMTSRVQTKRRQCQCRPWNDRSAHHRRPRKRLMILMIERRLQRLWRDDRMILGERRSRAAEEEPCERPCCCCCSAAAATCITRNHISQKHIDSPLHAHHPPSPIICYIVRTPPVRRSSSYHRTPAAASDPNVQA